MGIPDSQINSQENVFVGKVEMEYYELVLMNFDNRASFVAFSKCDRDINENQYE